MGVTSLTYSANSGTLFPAGTTTVTVTAKDAANNTGTATFTVTVTPLSEVETWRWTYFGSPDDSGAGADDADPDGDGHNNLFEYVAGIDPGDPASRFELRLEMVPGHPDQKAIIFSPIVPGRTYTVQFKTDVSDAAWTILSDLATSDNGIERTVTDLSAGIGSRFYHVEISKP